MLSNAMVDVVLGLILMYLILSLVCTTINETIANVLRWRARTLKKGIDRLIDNDGVRRTFYHHGLIEGTSKALAGNLPSYLSNRTFATALLDSLDPAKPLLAFKDMKSAIERLPDSNIKDALISGLANGVKDVEALRAYVASWFDATMERVSGVYKRRMQLISFLVGLVVAVGMNADSYAVATALWADDALRQRVVETSGNLVRDAGSDLASLARDAEDLRNLRPLPIGWSDARGRPDYGWQASAAGWTAKILGWLFTALALMLGAPFWFDLLNRFVRLRGSGAKPPAEGDKKTAA